MRSCAVVAVAASLSSSLEKSAALPVVAAARRRFASSTVRRSATANATASTVTSIKKTKGGHVLVLPPQRSNYRRVHHYPPRPQHAAPPQSPPPPGVLEFSSPRPPSPPASASFYGTLAYRAALAAGLAYCFTEYGYDITLCEGPSMLPTIRPNGDEVVLIDKWSFRRYGIDGGPNGAARSDLARARQREFEASRRKEKKKTMRQQRQDAKSGKDKASHRKNITLDVEDDVWHEPYVSVTDKPRSTWRQALAHVRSPVSVGDVVVLQHPHRRGTICKRVLGLPGDQVLYYRGLLVVPDGHVWVEGDNPANSADSRQYGPVPASLIIGRVVARVWPLRGNAWMERGGRPRQTDSGKNRNRHHADDDDHPLASFLRRSRRQNHHQSSGSTVLPAGYEGQQIVKSFPKKMAATKDGKP